MTNGTKTAGLWTRSSFWDAWRSRLHRSEDTADFAVRHLNALQEECNKEIAITEVLQNIIDGYSWLAEGRGPFAYNDGRYDDEVMKVFRLLVETAPSIRNEPYQSDAASPRDPTMTPERTRTELRKIATGGYASTDLALKVIAAALLELLDDPRRAEKR